MRTTLTLDDDVAAQITRLRKDRDVSLKALVNQVLREGLRHVSPRRRAQPPFHTTSVDLGRCLPGNVDNVAEVLAVADGESFR